MKPKQEELEHKLALLTGACIKHVRQTGKAPSIQNLHRKVFNKYFASSSARKFQVIMEEHVYKVFNNREAKLYRDNRVWEDKSNPNNSLKSIVLNAWAHTEVPEAKHRTFKEEIINDLLGDKPKPSPLKDISLEDLCNEIHSRGFKVTLEM